jgi:hypothetical protein
MRKTWLGRVIDRLETVFMALPFAGAIKWAFSNWWRLSDVRRVVWACRAQLLSVAIGGGLIALTDQARDIVIAGAMSTTNYLDKIGVLATMLLWASVSWYWARVTLNFSFALPSVDANATEWNALDQDQQERRRTWRNWWQLRLPRFIGAGSIILVAVAFFKAARIYSDAHDSMAATFYVWSAVFVAMAFVFYYVVANRDSVAAWLFGGTASAQYLVPQRVAYPRIRDYDNPVAITFLFGSLILAPIFSALFILYPVGTSEEFGDAVRAILFGLAVMVPIVSLLVLISQSLRVPVFGIVLLWMLIAEPLFFGDNHDVRTLAADRKGGQQTSHETCKGSDTINPLKRMSIGEAFNAWYEASTRLPVPDKAKEVPVRPQPIIFVATAGGASRAAFWTSQVLGEIAAHEPDFSERLFMISGVSGGSLGAVAFRSLVEKQRREGASTALSGGFSKLSQDFLKNDFLTPAMATGLYVDLPYHAFPFLPSPADRAAALEKGWEAKACDTVVATGAKRFAWSDGFVSTFNGAGPVWPILALNGTSVERGKRLITSNVDFAGSNLSGPLARYDALTLLQRDIPISTAVTMSARFPVISPTGGIREPDGAKKLQMRVTDGGLFENFGAVTAAEVMRYVVERRADVQDGSKHVAPLAILISSDPSLDLLDNTTETGGVWNIVDANPDPPWRALAAPDCSDRAQIARARGNGWPECPIQPYGTATILVDPGLALYNGRTARGELAAVALADRIFDSRVDVRDRLARKLLEARYAGGPANSDQALAAAEKSLGTRNHIDFFHFRQCRLGNKKTPTMSWHDSEQAWDAMLDMTGLQTGSKDECGNGAEFFRLCTRLARLKGIAFNDVEATDYCDGQKTPKPKGPGWVKPAAWDCVPKDTQKRLTKAGAPDEDKMCGIFK